MQRCERWAEFAVAAISLSGSSEIIRRAICMLKPKVEKLLGRFDLETMSAMGDWQAPRKLIRIIEEIRRERDL
jgi:hypothetical protein